MVETSVNKRPKMNAHRNPSILIPETNLSARRIMMTFITKRKSPRVIKVSGSVRRVISGLMKILSNANTIEKIMAVSNVTMVTCGVNNFDKPNTATAMISKLTIHFMIVIYRKEANPVPTSNLVVGCATPIEASRFYPQLYPNMGCQLVTAGFS